MAAWGDAIATVCHLLPSAIILYWLLAAGSVLATVLPLPIPDGFKDAVRLAAARGKLWSNKPPSKTLGALSDISVPQSWFAHFYAVGAAFNLILLLALANAMCGVASKGPSSNLSHESLVALALFELHLVRRYLETTMVMRYPPGARMHVLAYIFGLSYYLFVPLSLLPGNFFTHHLPTLELNMPSPVALRTSVLCIAEAHGSTLHAHPVAHNLGTAIFLIGNLLQFWAHCGLALLSRQNTTGRTCKSDSKPGFYKIPQGGLFEWISCPHYFAEIVVYVGFVAILRLRLNSLLILVWVVVNLVLAANATQRWYQQTFPTYPKHRKKLIPGLF